MMKLTMFLTLFFYGIKTFSMLPGIENSKPDSEITLTTGMKTLEMLGKECIDHLDNCKNHNDFKKLLSNFENYPKQNFAVFWFQNRARMIGVAQMVRMRRYHDLDEQNIVRAKSNCIEIEFFDKCALELIEKFNIGYFKQSSTESPKSYIPKSLIM